MRLTPTANPLPNCAADFRIKKQGLIRRFGISNLPLQPVMCTEFLLKKIKAGTNYTAAIQSRQPLPARAYFTCASFCRYGFFLYWGLIM